MDKKKVTKVRELLDQVYFFSQEEIDSLMERIPYMEEEGLDKLQSTLEKALEDQNGMLKKWTERDPKFAEKLEDFADETAKGLIREAETKEHESAEDVLKEIQ